MQHLFIGEESIMRNKLVHTREFLFALVLGVACAYSYYKFPPIVMGFIIVALVKTSMELRRLAKGLGVPLLPGDEQ